MANAVFDMMEHRGYRIERLGNRAFAIRRDGQLVGYADSWAEAGRRIDETLATEALIAQARAA